MRPEHLLIAAIVIYAITAFAKASNRPAVDKPSWMVRGWNASGAPKVEATRFLPAMGELAGRAMGTATVKAKDKAVEQADAAKATAARKTAEAAERGRAVIEAATRRWDQRGERAPLLWRRIQTKDDAAEGEGSAPDAPAFRDPFLPEPAEDTPAPADADAARPPDPAAPFTPGSSRADVESGPAPADPVRPDDERSTDRPRLHIVPEEGTPVTATTDAPAATTDTGEAAAGISAYAPFDWRALAARVATFHAESDAELINFMTGEVAGICGYAEAYEALHEDCLNSLGLDPNSVQGLGEFAEHVMELTRAMTAAHQRFVTTYEEVMKAVANGVVLPYNGRWMTGEAV
ncbi:hypothetical protein ACSDR0_11575 [Streptosporangium sp. G11]|uniref:hypothetical protein n=1 Tax=Streptosporangium sp. G11 TaxID=3436926 RepID=UPI003EC12E0B